MAFFNRIYNCISRSWIPVSNLKRFEPKAHDEVKKLNSHFSAKIVSDVLKAKRRAAVASKLDIIERKNSLCHLFKFSGNWGLPWKLNLTGVEWEKNDDVNIKIEREIKQEPNV